MLDVPRDLDYAPVYTFDAMLITPPDHPLASKPELRLEDLSPYGLILPPRRLTTYRLVDLVFQQNRVSHTVALEVGGWEVIKQYVAMRSEEHTSELQSLMRISYAVFCLKKKT